MELGQEMTASGSDGDGDLLAGLPDELVLIAIITRLPWFTRPVCRAVSKAWRAWIDASTKRPEALIRSRDHHLPLLQECILLSAFHFRTFVARCCQGRPEGCGSGYRRIQWRGATYHVDRRWRELPSLQKFFPQPPEPLMRVASAGIVYAWTDGESPHEFVVKMDVAGGDWAWEKFPLPYYFTTDPLPCNGKMYFTGGEGESWTSLVDEREQGLPVKRWNRDNLRALRRKLPEESSGMVEEEELYCLIKHESPTEPTLEILAYDGCAKSWRTREMIAIPDCLRRSDVEDVQLVNGDCFEPAPDEGINAVWIDDEAPILRWFNSSVRQTWVEFECNARWEGKSLVYPQFIHGWLYGHFVKEEHDEQEEINFGRQEPLYTIMKGKMVVEQKQVVWEQRLDIECFQESNSREPEMVLPVHCYTLMA